MKIIILIIIMLIPSCVDPVSQVYGRDKPATPAKTAQPNK